MDENVVHLIKILEVAVIASLKFVIAPFEAERQGFNFEESLLITTLGGIFGVIIFSLIGEIIAYGWKKILSFFKKPLHQEEKPKKKFTWLRKFTIKTKMRFGLMGLVITTPAVLSIPIGTFMTHRFYRKKLKNILLLVISVLIWSCLLNGLAQYLKLSQYLPA